MCACVVAHTYHTEALLLKKSFAFVLLRFYSHAFVGTNQILATESKRWPRHAVQVEGKRWTISHGFAVTIKTAMTMANAVLTT